METLSNWEQAGKALVSSAARAVRFFLAGVEETAGEAVSQAARIRDLSVGRESPSPPLQFCLRLPIVQVGIIVRVGKLAQ